MESGVNSSLRDLRQNLGLTQDQLAQRIGVPRHTYVTWELGTRIPYPHNRLAMAGVFHTTVQEINRILMGEKLSGTIQQFDDLQGVKEYVEHNLFLKLTSVIDSGNYLDQRKHFASIIEGFDSMDIALDSSQITRRQATREAITNLAILPFVAPLTLTTRTQLLSVSEYDTFIKECGASLASFEHLSHSAESHHLLISYQCVARLLTELEAIIDNSSKHRNEAQVLATHCAILKTTLGWARVGPAETMKIARNAIRHADALGDINLQLSARSKLAWGYLFNDEQELALATAVDARMLLEQCKGRLPIGIQGGTYSTLAVMQAKNGIDPGISLRKAMAQGPDQNIQSGMEYTNLQYLKEQGQTWSYAGHYKEAMDAYQQIIDPQTLQKAATFEGTIYERWRLQVTSAMTDAAIGEGDKSNAVRYWVETVTGARRLDNKNSYHKCRKTFDTMKLVFRGDSEVGNLRDYLVKR